MRSEQSKSPRLVASVAEMLCVVAISTAWITFLFLAVEAARDARNEPLSLPQLKPWFDEHPWLILIATPIVATTIAAAFFGLAQFLLPQSVCSHFVWRFPPKADKS